MSADRDQDDYPEIPHGRGGLTGPMFSRIKSQNVYYIRCIDVSYT